jgi:hypothetical protein
MCEARRSVRSYCSHALIAWGFSMAVLIGADPKTVCLMFRTTPVHTFTSPRPRDPCGRRGTQGRAPEDLGAGLPLRCTLLGVFEFGEPMFMGTGEGYMYRVRGLIVVEDWGVQKCHRTVWVVPHLGEGLQCPNSLRMDSMQSIS